MEHLPSGHFLTCPLDEKGRKDFLKLYLEYRRSFPSKPTRPLTLAEHLSLDEFHVFRINRWFALADEKESHERLAGKSPALLSDDFLPRYTNAIRVIREEFSRRKNLWCHGHFKPQEIFRAADGETHYLTDFAHTKMYPEGYEFDFMVWADSIMAGDWNADAETWKANVLSWVDYFEPVAHELGIADFHNLARASLLERALGTILADICATDCAHEVKKQSTALIYALIDELL